MEALYIAQSGLVAQQTKLDAISNNIANINTDAYKKVSINFESLMRSEPAAAAADEIDPLDDAGTALTMNGVAVLNRNPDFSQGGLKLTEHPLDIALSGAGFLEVERPEGGRALSRGGRLTVDRDGFLTIGGDNRLAAQVNIPPGAGNLTISNRGIAEVELDDGRVVEIGTLDVVQVRDTEALQLAADGLYTVPQESELLQGEAGSGGFAEIRQGFREQSNVELTDEMVELIVAQRGFQLNARVVQLTDQILETINNLRR